MPEIGEVREFATGFMVDRATFPNWATPPVTTVTMQTEKRVWDGKQWCRELSPEWHQLMGRLSNRSAVA